MDSYGAGWPTWSPDGSKIAFQYGRGDSATINPDGSQEKTVFRGGHIPQWSTDGSHLIHGTSPSAVQDNRWDVYRTTVKGGARLNLTEDLDTRFLSGTPVEPVAWR